MRITFHVKLYIGFTYLQPVLNYKPNDKIKQKTENWYLDF